MRMTTKLNKNPSKKRVKRSIMRRSKSIRVIAGLTRVWGHRSLMVLMRSSMTLRQQLTYRQVRNSQMLTLKTVADKK